ncbi:MAG: hypothetical protein CMJ48_12745 [Planctomycetaceae bacterium]|nr:hypothetical protein [Planctomycetaceae bacterium]
MEDIQLPKTKIALSDGVIRKLGKDGAVIATFTLDDLKDIRCEKSADYPFPLGLIAVFSSLAVVAKQFIPSPGLGWTVSILCAGVSIFSVIIICGRRIVLETRDGTVGYPVVDGFEEAEGFAVSVRQRLNNRS